MEVCLYFVDQLTSFLVAGFRYFAWRSSDTDALPISITHQSWRGHVAVLWFRQPSLLKAGRIPVNRCKWSAVKDLLLTHLLKYFMYHRSSEVKLRMEWFWGTGVKMQHCTFSPQEPYPVYIATKSMTSCSIRHDSDRSESRSDTDEEWREARAHIKPKDAVVAADPCVLKTCASRSFSFDGAGEHSRQHCTAKSERG